MMSDGARNEADEPYVNSKAYSVNVKVQTQSSTSCSFCWFILALYPTLKDMCERDEMTFTAHLQKAHGLQSDIRP